MSKSLPPGVQGKREKLEDRSGPPGLKKVQDMLGLMGLTASDFNFLNFFVLAIFQKKVKINAGLPEKIRDFHPQKRQFDD